MGFFKSIIDPASFSTPLNIDAVAIAEKNGDLRKYKVLYIFGIRVASWRF